MSTEITAEPSMYERREAPEWPLNALPRHWMDALFSKMIGFYGARFNAMWQGATALEVKKIWAIELSKLSREQLKAGSESLTALPKPPTLPEFVNLCRQARAEQVAHTARKLEHFEPADQKVIDENLGRIRRVTRSMRFSSAHPGWAYDLLMRGTARNSQPLTVDVLDHCRDAILTTVGRAYPATLAGDRAQKCAEILARVIREAEPA